MSAYLSGSYEELSAQGQQYLNSNQYDKAQAIYERIYQRLSKMKSSLIERRPRLQELKLTSLRVLGDLAGFQGDYEQAIKYYEIVTEIDPEQRLEYQRAIAQMKIDQGQVEAGLDELRALAVSNAGHADPWLWLGVEMWAQGNNEEAITNLKRAAEMPDVDPQINSAAYSYLHDVYREENRLEEAETAWQQAWQVMEMKIEDISPLYQMYWDADDLEKARSWLSQEKNPLREGFYRGLFFQAEGAEKRAQSAWRKTAALNPLEHNEGHEAWAEAALRIDYPAERIVYALGEINSRNLINIRGLLLLAVALVRIGQLNGAESALQNAVDINRRARPRKELLSTEHWALFDELVADPTD